ncbi:MAG: penicillin-binding protein [Nocardioidaceae bacterium]|nr:penicillin-binding protein [Nocardioidaceae bacterium]MCO5323201.1 penicillin-binding protein [Nocardioidaceae bacterium]
MPSPPDPNSARPGYDKVLKHLAVMGAIAAAMGLLVAGLTIPVAASLGYTAKVVDETVQQFPEELDEMPLAQSSKVLAKNGKVIATFYDENRVNVRLDQIAPIMQKALVAIEDYRFYEHGALDLKGTLRAFVNNQSSGSTQGGSSITQQLAKMTAVTQAQTPEQRRAAVADTYQRKIVELRHAIAFEQKHTKDWILERYLNIAYFGDGAYGVQAAAKHYFSIDASELDTQQAAILAGLVKNPTGYSPVRFPDRAKARRDVVLSRMGQLNVIPAQEATALQQTDLDLNVAPTGNGCMASKSAPFYCDYVRRYLLDDPALGATVADRERLLDQGGLVIQTTMAPAFQRAATNAAQGAVDPTDMAIGALAMVEPGTGNVLGIGQSRPMGRDKAKGQTFLDYAVPTQYGDSNGFQAGSTFKLFVIAAALEQGMSPYTSISSPAQVSLAMNKFMLCNDQPYSSYDTWEPRNSTSSGTMNMYSGTQLSVNTFFAQLEQRTGICDPYRLATEMGVQLTNPKHEMVPSFTLGVADVSPLEMAEAYATFAARGKACQARPVARILNPDGSLFKDYPKSCSQVMEKDTADRVNDILRGVMAPGGFGSALNINKQSAGKTGTTQGNVAVWFNGYTPAVATAAMIAGANSNGIPMSLNGQRVGGSYIGTAHGSTVAGPMWSAAMRDVQDLLPSAYFTRPIYIAPPPPPPSASKGPDADAKKGNKPGRRGNNGKKRGR